MLVGKLAGKGAGRVGFTDHAGRVYQKKLIVKWSKKTL